MSKIAQQKTTSAAPVPREGDELRRVFAILGELRRWGRTDPQTRAEYSRFVRELGRRLVLEGGDR